MATVTKKQYEGMFLIDTAVGGSDWDGVIAEIESLLKKAEAEIISIRKWDERRLAYDIDKKSRGTYILTYFRCDGSKIQGLEKAVQLSERLMRVLILNADHMTQEDMEKDTPAIKAEKSAEQRKAAEQEQQDSSEETSSDITETAPAEPVVVETEAKAEAEVKAETDKEPQADKPAETEEKNDTSTENDDDSSEDVEKPDQA